MYRIHAGLSDWHLFNRGSRRMALFHDDQDSKVFLMKLREAAAVAGVVVWAYTLMTNHFHLVARATWEQLSRFMHRLQMLFSRYHNQRWNLNGHAFAGPYGEVIQGSRTMLLRTLAYVFMNPVAARRTDDPANWTWTSYRNFMGIGESWLAMNPMPLLGELSENPQDARDRLSEFLSAARLRIDKKPPTSEPTATDVHCDHFEWLLDRATERGAELDPWDPRLMAIVWAQNVGIFRSAVARVLGGPLSGALRVDLHRFRGWLAEDPQRQVRLLAP